MDVEDEDAPPLLVASGDVNDATGDLHAGMEGLKVNKVPITIVTGISPFRVKEENFIISLSCKYLVLKSLVLAFPMFLNSSILVVSNTIQFMTPVKIQVCQSLGHLID